MIELKWRLGSCYSGVLPAWDQVLANAEGHEFCHVAAFFPLALFCLYGTYHSCLLVSMRTLNVQRAELVLEKVLKDEKFVPSPDQVAKSERFIRSQHSVFSVPLLIEPPIENFLLSLIHI